MLLCGTEYTKKTNNDIEANDVIHIYGWLVMLLVSSNKPKMV